MAQDQQAITAMARHWVSRLDGISAAKGALAAMHRGTRRQTSPRPPNERPIYCNQNEGVGALSLSYTGGLSLQTRRIRIRPSAGKI